MSEEPRFSPCEIELAFGDADYLFRLPLKQIAELQEKCKAGIGAIYRRVLAGEYYVEDLSETIRLGLIGGGLDALKARTLCERYAEPMPKQELWIHTISILGACIVGYEPPGEQPGKPETAVTQEDGSTSPSHTGTEPSQEIPSSKSIGSPTGNMEPSASSGTKPMQRKTKPSRP